MDSAQLIMKIISGDEQSLLLGWHLVSGGENIGLPDHICMEKRDGKWVEQGLQESVLWKLLEKESDRDKFNRAIDSMLQKRTQVSQCYITISTTN